MKVYDFWARHRYAAMLSVALFLASLVFVQMLAQLSIPEYGNATQTSGATCRLDCNWYARIIDEGYYLEPRRFPAHPNGDAANWAFFPAFPIASNLLKVATGLSTKSSLVIMSKVFFLLALFAFITAAGEELGSDVRLLAGTVLAFNPYIIYAHVGYTESLYFLLVTLAFLASRHGNWVLAGIWGGALSATRLVGVLFAVAYFAASYPIASKVHRDSWPSYLLGLLICPIGLGLFMLYLYFHMGDALAFKHVQIAWNRVVGNPLAYLVLGMREEGADRYYALVAVAALLMSFWLAVCRRYDYAIFLALATLVPLSTGLVSMPRYVFWQMPFLLGLVELLSKSRYVCLIYLAFSATGAGLVILAWFSGRAFVI